jgi:hypothetical protein
MQDLLLSCYNFIKPNKAPLTKPAGGGSAPDKNHFLLLTKGKQTLCTIRTAKQHLHDLPIIPAQQT